MHRALHNFPGHAVEDTARVETFSDAVYAIVATLLILELKVPVVTVPDSGNFIQGLSMLAPEFAAFAFSFFIVAVYWVNHHHFFHNVEKTDWKLMWYNNFHLFWIATVPFTTAFIGAYPFDTIPVFVYGLDMVLCALSIMLMIKYVFFKSSLLYAGYAEERKHSEFKRGMTGVYLYSVAALSAFVHVYIALALFIAIPFLFVVPQLLSDSGPHS